MATFTDIFKFLVTADGTQAVQGFKKVEAASRSTSDKVAKDAQSLSQRFGAKLQGIADKSPVLQKALGSVGVSAQQLGAMLPVAIGAGAVAAGGAIAAFAVKGIKQFEDTALAAGKLADATGLNVEAASRWNEVAGDIGISSETVRGTFVKMEKAISTNRAAFGDLVKTGKDGSVDLSATFLATAKHLQGIKDPIDRANESAKLFGRGFSEVAELIGMNADDLQKRLDAVSKQKVISEDELKRAREFRDAMQQLRDRGEDLSITLGQALVPVLTTIAQALDSIAPIAAKAGDALGAIQQKQADLQEQAKKGGFHTGIPIVDVSAGILEKAFNNFREGTGLVEQQSNEIVVAGRKVHSYEEALKAAGDGTIVLATRISDAKIAAEQGAQASTKLADANDRYADRTSQAALQTKAVADAYRDAANAALGYIDAQMGVNSAQLAVINATEDANKAILEGAKAGQGNAKAQLEQKVAIDQVVAAGLRLGDEQAKLKGQTEGSKAATQTQIAVLKTLAATATGPVKAALEATITRLQLVGQQHPRPTVDANTAPATAKAADVQRRMDALDKTRARPTIDANDQASGKVAAAQARVSAFAGTHASASIYVNVDTASANARLTALRNRLNAAASQGVQVLGRAGLHLSFAEGGLVPGPIGRPLAAMVHGGEYVLSSDIVNRIRRGSPSEGARTARVHGGDSASVYNITIQAGVGDPVAIGREVKKAIAAAERAGVR